MNHLQAQMDALNAGMQGDAELSQLDSAMADALAASKKVYRDITKAVSYTHLNAFNAAGIIALKKRIGLVFPSTFTAAPYTTNANPKNAIYRCV